MTKKNQNNNCINAIEIEQNGLNETNLTKNSNSGKINKCMNCKYVIKLHD